MKNHHRIKLIAASVALITSFGAAAGLGGLNVRSHLGEPFTGSITVTGDEAKALLGGGKASISNSNLRASVRKSGDNAVVTIRSSKPIQDPILIFQVGVGSQSREYTAIIDPAGYNGTTDGATRVARAEPSEMQPKAEARDRRAAESAQSRQVRKTANDKKAAAKAGKAAARNAAVYGQRHLVRQGETVSVIARKIRPQGLTLEQTILALVNANPGVFIDNDADRMLAGKVLTIPQQGEWARLAAQAPSERPSSQADAAGKAASETAKVETAATGKPEVAPETAAPEKAVSTVAASVPEAAPAVASEAQTQAEAPQQASAPAIAEASADKPVAEKAVAEKPAEDAGEGGWWRWLLLGGAALIALLLLSKLLGKRKAASVEEDEGAFESDEEPAASGHFTADVEERSSVTAAQTAVAGSAAAAVAAAAPVSDGKPEDEGLDIEDDFGDDIFFTDVEAAPAGKQDGVKLDLSTLDNSQNGILSGAVTRDEETEKRRDIDWDEVESTESVYEPEPERSFESFTANHGEKQEIVTAQPVEETFSAVEQAADEADDDEEESAKIADDGSWNFFASEPETEKAEPVVEQAVVQPAAVEPDAVLAVETAADEPEITAASVADDEPLEFVAPEIDDLPVAPVVSEAAVSEEPELFDIRPAEKLSFQDGEDLDGAAPQVAEADEVIEWENISVDTAAEAGRSSTGFISESVGMTAPLEAKYELAKMYIEIGDPEAARETLQELLEESDGDILAKAKGLLKEIDGQ